MNKKELVAAIAEKTEMKKVDAEASVNAIVEVISEELANGGEIALSGLGKFSVKERAARTGRNPQTGETIEIAASKAPAFKAAKALKDAVKNS
jgi:DNA-binding protein HU-beta